MKVIYIGYNSEFTYLYHRVCKIVLLGDSVVVSGDNYILWIHFGIYIPIGFVRWCFCRYMRVFVRSDILWIHFGIYIPSGL